MSIESRLKTVRRNTGNHKSESAMSKENLKKNKKNYWFSITLIALALFCVGAALLYSQKLLSEKLSTPKAPVASYTARYGARSISKVQFLKRDRRDVHQLAQKYPDGAAQKEHQAFI